jgi:hypothetical protein
MEKIPDDVYDYFDKTQMPDFIKNTFLQTQDSFLDQNTLKSKKKNAE